jgi:hypothetical protein
LSQMLESAQQVDISRWLTFMSVVASQWNESNEIKRISFDNLIRFFSMRGSE